jgi:DNA-directed RNA polymerase specialized sigma24 family protein
MNHPHLPPGSDDTPFGSEFHRRLSADDEGAWQVLLRRLLPQVRELLERRLAADDQPLAVRQTEKDTNVGEKSLDRAEAAVWMAWSSFRRRYLTGEFADARNLTELAVHLFQIAYNRRLKDFRHGIRMPHEARDGGGSPEEEAIAQDLDTYLRRVVEEVCEGLSAPHRQMIRGCLALDGEEGPVQQAVAKAAGCHQSTVSRVLTRFRDRIRLRLGEGG